MLGLYALGSMLGAGIYGLVGQVAGLMGGAVWMSFVVAMCGALLTGLAYASLGARYPRAGGAAYIVGRAFRSRLLAYVVGLSVVGSGLASMAAGSHVVAGNIQALFGLQSVPELLFAIAYLAALAVLIWRGLRESMWFNALATFIEVGGLLLVIVVGARFWGQQDLTAIPSASDWTTTMLILAQGAVLSFFSFLGFEDALNVSEEVKNPARNLPIGLITAMFAATLIYLGVAITAVSVVSPATLAEAPAPLEAVMGKAAPWLPSLTYTIITIFAVANTGLINFVMASRLVFGLSRQGLLPKPLSRIHPKRGTPHISAIAVLVAASLLASAGDVSQLAAATVLLLLGVFILMDASAILLGRRADEPLASFNVHPAIPAAGALICLGLLIVRALTGDARAPTIAAVLIAMFTGLYFLTKSGHRPDADLVDENLPKNVGRDLVSD
ncbi:MAG: amino acid permease [Hyphomonadaceae bacterium]